MPCTDYEGCFTDPTHMRVFYTQIITWVQDYATATYESPPAPDNWYYIITDQSGKEPCTDGKGNLADYSDWSMEYCPTDQNVYVGEQAMWHYYQEFGDAAPAVAIAHEWGHHLQYGVVGITERADHAKEDAIAVENQADCVSGAWSAYLADRQIMVEDDYVDVGNALVAVGQAEGPDRDHGTAEERQQAWVEGYVDGLNACNRYFPNQPLIT